MSVRLFIFYFGGSNFVRFLAKLKTNWTHCKEAFVFCAKIGLSETIFYNKKHPNLFNTDFHFKIYVDTDTYYFQTFSFFDSAWCLFRKYNNFVSVFAKNLKLFLTPQKRNSIAWLVHKKDKRPERNCNLLGLIGCKAKKETF